MTESQPSPSAGWEPRIIGFLCNWCSYSGADSAGRAQRDVPPQVKIVRVMCSGRVDMEHVMEALHCGADGVMVLGCHPGDCHYKEGNYKTLRRMTLLGKLLAQLGFEEARVRLDWVSASEGEKFADVTARMVEDIRQLGPCTTLNDPEEGWLAPQRHQPFALVPPLPDDEAEPLEEAA